MTNDIKSKIRLIKSEAKLKKLVIFIGSGVSVNSGYRSWSDLVHEYDEVIGYSQDDNPVYSTSELLRIPQYLYNENESTYYEILENNFGFLPEKTNPIIDVLLELEPKHIITTNYDELIEMSLEKSSIYGEGTDEDLSKYQVIRSDKDLIAVAKSSFLIKMHGDLKAKKSIVLKEDDYLDYSNSHILIETFIKSLLIDHSFLFVGYSLSDYNLQLIMSWVENILRKHDEELEFGRKKHFFINPQSQGLSVYEKKYFSEKNVEIIEFSDLNGSGKESEKDDREKELSVIGKNLYLMTKRISKENYSIDNLESVIKGLRILDSMRKMTLSELAGLLGIPSVCFRRAHPSDFLCMSET